MKKSCESNFDYSRRHTRINPTGIPPKFWVAVDDYSEQLNNYSKYVDLGNLQLVDIKNNNIPSSTQDKRKIWDIANKIIMKYPGKYVFIGQDKSSYGMQTGKNHLRASVITWWSPKYKMWSTIPEDIVNELRSNKIALSESVDKQAILDTAFSTIIAVLNGESDKILKDDEWCNYLINDIRAAIREGMFKATPEDFAKLDAIVSNRMNQN